MSVRLEELWHDEDNRAYLAGELFTGTAVDYWPNGILATEVEYRKGVEDGWVRGWYENGKIRSETFFIEGRPRGERREWYESGRIKLERVIGDRAECIAGRDWDEDGHLTREFRS